MADGDDRLDRDLRNLYSHIESTPRPASITNLTPESIMNQRRIGIHLGGAAAVIALAAATAVAVVAAHPTRSLQSAAPAHTAAPSLTVPSPTPHPSVPTRVAPPPLSSSADPTAGWTTVSDPSGQFSFRIPPTWLKTGECVDTTVSTVLFVAPTAGPGGGLTCDDYNAGTPEMIKVEWTSSGASALSAIPDTSGSYATYTTTDVTVHGVLGNRVETTTDSTHTGSAFVQYSFVANGRSYSLILFPTSPSDPMITTLNTIVTHTWQFQS